MELRRKRLVTHVVFNDEGYIGLPTIDPRTYSYIYLGIEIFDTINKGKGIRATSRLVPGDIFPYGGIYIDDAVWMQNQQKNAGRIVNYTGYMIDSGFNKEGLAVAWLDGHPRHYPCGAPNNGWPGTMVNEPDVGGSPNAELVLIDLTNTTPKYPHICSNMNVFVCARKVIEPGEEVTVDYGYSRRVYARLGYPKWNEPVSVTAKRTVAERQTKSERMDYAELNGTKRVKQKKG